MSHFRAKRLDLGAFVNTKIVRDHTKRKTYELHEPERYALVHLQSPHTHPDPAIKPSMYRQDTDRNARGRQALRYIIRNTSLPQRTRAQAQLQLTQMHCYTHAAQIKNRCMMGGKGRGILSDFRMSRVCMRLGPLQSLMRREGSVEWAGCRWRDC